MTQKNTNKKMLTAAVAGVATVAGVSAMTTAHADEVKSAQPVNNQTQENPAQKAHEDAVKHVEDAQKKADQAAQDVTNAQNQANQANDDLNQAKDAQTAQQGQVDSAQGAVNDAQKRVNDAQNKVDEATKNAADSTPENIDKAQKAVDDQQKTIDADQSKVTKAENDADKAQADLNKAQADAKGAQDTVNNKQSALDQANDNLKNAQDVLNNSDSGKAQKALDDATAKVKQDQTDINNQQKAVDDATQAVSQADTDMKNAKKAAEDAQADAKAKSDADATATDQLNQAQTARDQAQKTVDGLNDKLTNVNTITLPAGYKEAFEAFENGMDSHDITDAQLDALSDKLRKVSYWAPKNNVYKDSEADKLIHVDYKNLTLDQQKELAMFASDLVNQIRHQMGIDVKVQVTPESVKWGNDLIKTAYNDPSWDGFGEHMTDGKRHNNKALDATPGFMGENMSAALQAYTEDDQGNTVKMPIANNLTMNDLKATIYHDIRVMMFGDAGSRWGHAENFVGMGSSEFYKSQVMAVDFDKYGYSHFDLGVGDTKLADGNKLGDNAYAQESQQGLLDQLNTAKQDLTTKEANLNTAKQAKTAADQDLAKANDTLKTAQSALLTKSTTKDKADKTLADAQASLVTAQSKLADDQNLQKQAQQNLDAYSADIATKQKAVDDAQGAVTSAQKALDDAKDVLSTKQKAVADAQAKVKTAQQAVTDAQGQLKADQSKLADLQAHVKDLQNAPQLLANAKADLAKAQADLKAKQDALKSAQDALAPLTQAVKTAQDKADQAQAALTEAQKAKTDADAELAAAKDAAKTDAEKYGNDVHIADINVEAGIATLGDPQITNPQAAPATNDATKLFVMMAQNAGVQLPYGTKAEWVNYQKALADAQHAGHYQEDVLVSFPDGSSVVKTLNLNVSAKSSAGDNQPVFPGKGDGKSNTSKGVHIDGDHVVDANGHVISGLVVKNGRIYNVQGRDVTSVVIGNIGKVSATARKAQAKLPQTGDSAKAETAMASVGLMIAFAGMLGLRKRN